MEKRAAAKINEMQNSVHEWFMVYRGDGGVCKRKIANCEFSVDV